MPDETDIQKLLRLKRFEQPPEEYFDSFLEEFQRRQRTELLRRSLWEIVCDRTGAFLSQFTVPQYAYGAASAVVLMVAGVVSVGILSSDPASPRFAAESIPSDAIGRVQPAAAGTALVYSPSSLGSEIDFSNGNVQSLNASAGEHPRYVIDARPVSYEAPFSF